MPTDVKSKIAPIAAVTPQRMNGACGMNERGV